MKKILLFAFITLLLFSLCAVAGAENAENSEQAVVENVSTVVKTSGIAAIGTISVAVVTAIALTIKKFGGMIVSIISALKTVFSKDGKIENLPTMVSTISKSIEDYTTEFKTILKEEQARYDELEAKYKEQAEENDKFKQALAVFFLYTNGINPSVKNELYRLIKGEIPFKETLEETIKDIKETVERYNDSEAATPTPYLDSVEGK